MGRITLIIATLALMIAPGCKRDRTSQPAGTPKTTERADEAEDQAEAALETAREAKATADSALETAREAQAAARASSDTDDGSWWQRWVEGGNPDDITPADRNAAKPADPRR